jgi:hypothetical protein
MQKLQSGLTAASIENKAVKIQAELLDELFDEGMAWLNGIGNMPIAAAVSTEKIDKPAITESLCG